MHHLMVILPFYKALCAAAAQPHPLNSSLFSIHEPTGTFRTHSTADLSRYIKDIMRQQGGLTTRLNVRLYRHLAIMLGRHVIKKLKMQRPEQAI